jgi:hypothetical protein
MKGVESGKRIAQGKKRLLLSNSRQKLWEVDLLSV